MTKVYILIGVITLAVGLSQARAEDAPAKNLWGDAKTAQAEVAPSAHQEEAKEIKKTSKKKKKKEPMEPQAVKVIHVAPTSHASPKSSEAPPIAHEAPQVSVPSEPTGVATSPASNALQVSGFIDAQFQATSRYPYNGTSNQNSRGFSIHDGALYVSKAVGNGEAKLDIPFSLRDKGGKTIGSGTDSTGAAVTVTSGNSVDFDIATVRAQAYVAQKYENGLRWKLGQFDTSYGFEVNDTADIALSRQGYVYNYTDPFVHTGLQLGWDFTPTFGLNLLAANRKDSGLQRNDRLQYGLQLVSTMSFRWSLGGIYQKALNGRDDYYADLTVGKNFGGFAVDAEASFNNNEASGRKTKNTLGYLLSLVQTFSPRWSAAIRGEYLTNATIAGTTTEKTYLIFAGPQVNLTDALKLKVDYMYDSRLVTSGLPREKVHGGQLSAVHRF